MNMRTGSFIYLNNKNDQKNSVLSLTIKKGATSDIFEITPGQKT
jgi:hypothetical protein